MSATAPKPATTPIPVQLSETEFDAFVTMDRGIEYQQNLAGFNLAVVLLRAVSNRLADLLPLLPELVTALRSAVPGQLQHVPKVGAV